MPQFNRILITGASGGLGTLLRKSIASMTHFLRISDVKKLTAAAPSEEIVLCDLADADAVLTMTHNVDMVIHMGGAVGAELPFKEILEANVIGSKNLYEACRKNGVKRVIWGSSTHAVGFYSRTQNIDASAMPRPDSLYGVSKVFGEAMAQYYWDKFKLESVSVRIGSCFPKPTDRRMLTTWLSYPDFVHLIESCLRAPRVEHTIVYGVSNNDSQLYDNRMAAHLGFRPRDNAEVFRAEIEAASPPYHHDDINIAVHGGRFAAAGHLEDQDLGAQAANTISVSTRKWP
jgi:uronate dehydrogenase